MATLYSCGFLFDPCGLVALIRKNRPDWQLGKLNGVGGHVEAGETFHDCMVREFKEEAGLLVPEWKRFVNMRSPDWGVAFFHATVPHLGDVETKTDEPIVVVNAYQLPADTVPNLQWLIPMVTTNEPCTAEVTYQ